MTPKPKAKPKGDDRFKWPEQPSLRYIIRQALLPRKDLCEIQGCPEALENRDEAGFLIGREHCEECPLVKMDEAIAHSIVLHRVFDLDFALKAGIHITLSDIDVEEFRALKILRMERTRLENQEIQNAQRGK